MIKRNVLSCGGPTLTRQLFRFIAYILRQRAPSGRRDCLCTFVARAANTLFFSLIDL